MHGLRCTGELQGWTRLLDEWCVGFGDRFFPESGASCFASRETTLHTLADAARRVRLFAQKGNEPVVPGAHGELRFELQGIDYVVLARQLWPESVDGMSAAVQGALDDACRDLARVVEPAEDRMAVGLVFVTPRLPGLSPEARGAELESFRRAVREEAADGAAWLIPVTGSDFGKENVDATHPAAALFFRIVR